MPSGGMRETAGRRPDLDAPRPTGASPAPKAGRPGPGWVAGAPGPDSLRRLQRVAGNRAVVATLRKPADIRRFHEPDAADQAKRQAAATYMWGASGAGTRTRDLTEQHLTAIGQPDALVDDRSRRRAAGKVWGDVLDRLAAGPDKGPTLGLLAAADRNDAAASGRVTAALDPNGDFQRQLELAIRVLNVVEQETAVRRAVSREDQGDPLDPVLIGTEFTFTDDDVRKVRLGQASKEAPGIAKMKTWKERLTALPTGRLKPTLGPHPHPKASEGAFRATYTLPPKTWWWNLDLDEACLETQTMPTSRSDLLRDPDIKRIIQAHIFALAADLQLETDPTSAGGGGHISLDVGTLLGGSGELLLELLQGFQQDYEAWKAETDYDDPPNSPWLAEQGYQTGTVRRGREAGAALDVFNRRVDELRRQLQSGEVDALGITRALAAVQSAGINLHVQKQLSQSPSREERAALVNVASHPAHYQAVNLEHAADANVSSRRIELRSIGAQTDYDRLMRDLSFIEGYVADAIGKLRKARDL